MGTILEKLRETWPEVMKVRLTKLKEAPNPQYPNNREVGEINTGYGEESVMVGDRYTVMNANKTGRFFRTSTIQEIISRDWVGRYATIIFRTHNSIYQLEILDDDDQTYTANSGGLGEGSSEGSDIHWSGPRGAERPLGKGVIQELKDLIRKIEEEL